MRPVPHASQQTALYVASFFGRHEIVELLLQHGADRFVWHNGAYH